ncbi:hypothetical protein AYO38_11220 [bacterium SCGC AG-212-C10]|nr:hypothetical protein AYO38_11220 [bacterium SCGC AG-212-C10]
MENGGDQRRTALQVSVVSPLPAVRAGLRAMLSEAPDLEVTATASFAWDEPPSQSRVMVIDLQDAGELQAIEDALGHTPAVFLAATPGDFESAGAGTAGRGYLLDDTGAEELQAAVRAVAAGLVVYSAGVPSRPATRATTHATGGELSPLTERELQVLRLMGDGLPNKAIALRLGITEHTIKFHVGAILSKLDAGSRTEAVTIAVRRGVLPL